MNLEYLPAFAILFAAMAVLCGLFYNLGVKRGKKIVMDIFKIPKGYEVTSITYGPKKLSNLEKK